MWDIDDDERRGIRPQPPCARRVPGGVGQLLRCFSLTMKEHRLLRSALHLTPRHQERNPVYSSDRPRARESEAPGLSAEALAKVETYSCT